MRSYNQRDGWTHICDSSWFVQILCHALNNKTCNFLVWWYAHINKITYDALVLTNRNGVSYLDIHLYLLFLFVLNAQLYWLFGFPSFFFIFEFQWHDFLVLSHTTIFSRNWWQISFYWQATMYQQIVSHDRCRIVQCAKCFSMTMVYIRFVIHIFLDYILRTVHRTYLKNSQE